MKKSLTILILALTTAFAVSGQRVITGRIVDSSTKSPVKVAKVKLAGTSIEASVNVLGYFRLTIDTATQLIIESPGYGSAKVRIPEVDNFQIPLVKEIPPLTIHQFAERQPQYTGGLEAQQKFIVNNLRYPREAKRLEIEGKVFVSFVVDTTGAIMPDRTSIVKGIFPACDEEALRVVSSFPNWIPGNQGGKNVRVRYVVPVLFKLPR